MKYIIIFITALSLYGGDAEACAAKGEKFIYAGGECIQTYTAKGEREGELTILVHGTWDKGANTIARYATFADDMNMITDITTVAVALPGYSESSSNKIKPLYDKLKEGSRAQSKAYIEFLSDLVSKLKEQHGATTLNYVGHSAGAMMGATLSGYKPELIANFVGVGGRYALKEGVSSNKFVTISEYLDQVKGTKYLLIYGTNDTISKPEVTTSFYTTAKKIGLDVTLVEVQDGVHLDLDMTDTSKDAMSEMFGE
jgi:predicted esterase